MLLGKFQRAVIWIVGSHFAIARSIPDAISCTAVYIYSSRDTRIARRKKKIRLVVRGLARTRRCVSCEMLAHGAQEIVISAAALRSGCRHSKAHIVATDHFVPLLSRRPIHDNGFLPVVLPGEECGFVSGISPSWQCCTTTPRRDVPRRDLEASEREREKEKRVRTTCARSRSPGYKIVYRYGVFRNSPGSNSYRGHLKKKRNADFKSHYL